MKPLRFALFGALAVAAALPAFAQPGPGGGPGGPGRGGRGPAAMFNQVDANHDSKVTWDEAWGFIQQRFAQADANRDGGLTLEEAQTLRFGPEGRGRRGQGRGGPPAATDAAPGAAPTDGREARRAAWAERHAQMTGMMFRAFDANRDGKVTLEEVQPFAQARFRSMDANGDNAVTLDEVPQHHGRHGHGHGRGGPGGGGGPGPQGGPPPAR